MFKPAAILLTLLCLGAAASPQSAEARPRRHRAPEAPLVVLQQGEVLIKATWTVPSRDGADRPVWRLRGRFWTWTQRGWAVADTRWSPWLRARRVPKQLKTIAFFVKAPAPRLSDVMPLVGK